MEDWLLEAVVNVIFSGAFLGVLIAGMRKIWVSVQALKDDARSRDKADICKIFRESLERGWLWDFELENAERLFYNYKALNGNHYIEDVMARLRNGFEVRVSGIDLNPEVKQF